MNCPKCGAELVKKFYKGMLEVDYCPNCQGMWLDFDELDTLEDVAFDDDEHKGSLVHHAGQSQCRCPHCGEPLQEFQYRLYDLRLETCAANGHGFWLDAGEDERVIEIMAQRARQFGHTVDAASEWKVLLRRLRAKGLRDLFP